MANSTLSLDSLSSPSPSPPPPPQAKVTQLDPDSELSELTDDDQDASDAVDKRAPSVKQHDDNSHPMPSTSTSKVSRRGTYQRSSSRRGGAVGRKKRSSIVPAPMWGWAENKAASTSSAAAPVEEEEEEMSGPPRAMEEEEEEEVEEEEDEEEPEDGDFGVNEDAESGRGYGPLRRMGSYRYTCPPQLTRHFQQRPRRARKGWRQPDGEPKEDLHEDAPDHNLNDPHDTNNKNPAPTINGGDEDDEGSASGSPYPSTSRKKRSNKQRAPPASSSSSAALRKRKENGGGDHYSSSERPAHSLKKKKAENNNRVQHDQDEEVSNAPASTIPVPLVSSPRASSDNENTESEEEPSVLPPAAVSPPTVKPISPIATIIAMNNNPVELSALTALAAAADSIDVMDTIPHSNSTPAVSSIIPGFGLSGSIKSLEAPTASLTSAALTTGANSSRSPSPAAKWDAEASSAEDEPRPTRSKARNGKSAIKSKGGNIKGKAGDKDTSVIANGTEASTQSTTKKGPPPPLNLVEIDEPLSLPVVVEDDVNDRSLDDREDVDMDDPEEEEEEEEEEPEEEEEAEEPEEQADEEANEVDEEAVDPEGDDDQEQDGADNEDMEEGENGEENENENENDEDPSPDGDADGDEHEESDLQPAHRAEALDVLATIELKFALLRERLYVEKMEGLAWEERMIQACMRLFHPLYVTRTDLFSFPFFFVAAHPEMQHLQKELTKRRDKRLELASRKRSYEVANASKRRRADEDGVWSWWKVGYSFDAFLVSSLILSYF